MILSVIVVYYNSGMVLRRCLESLARELAPLSAEGLVLDNGSTDGLAPSVTGEFPWVKLLVSSRNLGYAGAINEAVGRLRSPYILVANPDTEFLPGAVSEMVDFMEKNKDAGLVGPRLLSPQGKWQPSGRQFYTLSSILYRRTFLGRLSPHSRSLRNHLLLDLDQDQAREVDWVQGACMMIRKKALAQVKGLDAKFFLYFEDVDLCFRLWQAGWKVYYLPQARVIHHYARQSAKKFMTRAKLYHLKSALYFFIKHRGFVQRPFRP